MGLHVCQMMGYEQIDNGLKLITENSARAMQLEHYGLAVGDDASLIILPAENGFDAVRRQVAVRYSVRQGRLVAATQPAVSEIYLAEAETVNFKR